MTGFTPFVAVGLPASVLTSMNLSFFTCKMGCSLGLLTIWVTFAKSYLGGLIQRVV